MPSDRDDVLLKFAKAVRRGLFQIPDDETLDDLDDVITRLESQGEAEDATPPPADEVSDETLRMFAATIAPDNESLRVTARAALAARVDLAAARRERDEARAEVERLRRVLEDVHRGARAALSPTTEEPKP